MADNPRIDELRRRIDKDPSSIAFAQLAEEYRRAGEFQQAVKVCRDGLARHPGYLSAQVTLGRALMELEEFEDAQRELEGVLHVAPDNLAAIRALADIHQRRGDARESVDFHAPVQKAADEPVMVDEPLDVPPLDEAAPVDVSLDASMPSFDDIAEVASTPIDLDASGEQSQPGEEDLPSLDALDALTLDVPPLPDLGSWTLDTDLALDLPDPTFADASIDQLETTVGGSGDPVLDELEEWLAAIVADRSASR